MFCGCPRIRVRMYRACEQITLSLWERATREARRVRVQDLPTPSTLTRRFYSSRPSAARWRRPLAGAGLSQRERLHFSPQLLQHLRQMKLQFLQILFVFFLCDRTRFFLRLQVGDLIDQFFLAVDKILPAFLSSQRFFVKLDRVTEAPKQKCADCEDDKPRVRTHCVGDIDSSRSLDLQEEQQQRHQRFSLAPQSAQNLFVFGFLLAQEGQVVVDRSLRAEISRRINASRSLDDSRVSIC